MEIAGAIPQTIYVVIVVFSLIRSLVLHGEYTKPLTAGLVSWTMIKTLAVQGLFIWGGFYANGIELPHLLIILLYGGVFLALALALVVLLLDRYTTSKPVQYNIFKTSAMTAFVVGMLVLGGFFSPWGV